MLALSINPIFGEKEFIVKCAIDNQIVLSRVPEGPLATYIGPFTNSLSQQGYSLTSIRRQVRSLRVLAYGSSSGESRYAASPPITRHSICDIAFGRCGHASGMPLRSGIGSIFCAGKG
jgi:hypothetical protein